MSELFLKQGSFVRNPFSGGPDDRRQITFFREAVLDQAASERQGRPIYRDEERWEMRFPGNQLSIPTGRVTDVERQLYAREYEAFLKSEDVAVTGTPLEELKYLTIAQIKELKYFNVYTIEDGANISESNIQRMGMGATRLRAACQAYLAEAAKQAPLVEMVAVKEKLEEKVALQAAQLDQMNHIIMGMQSQLAAYAQAPRVPEVGFQAPQHAHEAPVASALDSIGEEPRQKRPYRRKAAA